MLNLPNVMQSANEIHIFGTSMMKLRSIAILLLLAFFANGYSQSCLPDGVTFTTQTQIDNFSTNYPNCDEIEGNVTITGSNISNLQGLNIITIIHGNLAVIQTDSLEDFSGLNNLISIGDQFIVGWWENNHNRRLKSFHGLENLRTIGSIFTVRANPLLSDFTGLDSLRSVFFLEIGKNERLSSLNGLVSLDSIHYGLIIAGTDSLVDLQGLSHLTFVKIYIEIKYNESLLSLSGLDNLTHNSLEYFLTIKNNPKLSYCEVQSICERLSDTSKHTEIYNNKTGCNSAIEVEDACLVYTPEKKHESKIRFWPNPASDKITIQGEYKEVYIYNQVGHLVLNYSDYKREINISSLESGLYVLVIVTIKGKEMRKLIIK
jgi:type IX secretion system substrate protein/receptor L domain-containing protein